MVYLILTLLGSCGISYGFKLASIKKTEQDYIVFFNYFTAFLGMLVYCAFDGGVKLSGLNQGSMGLLALLLMLFMFGNLAGNNTSTDRNGINSTTFFNRIGFLPCILLSAVIWREWPSLCQILGMGILIGSLLFMLKDMKQVKGVDRLLLFSLTWTSGMVSLLNIVYGKYFPAETEVLFLTVVFFLAAVFALVILLLKGKKPWNCGRNDLTVGLFIGASNIITTLFMLKSYTVVSANIVAPTTAAGNMIFAAVSGKLLFKEEVNRNTRIALGMAIASVILVNV